MITYLGVFTSAVADPRKPAEVEFSGVAVTTSFLGPLDRAFVYFTPERVRLDLANGGSIFFDATTHRLLVANPLLRRIEDVDVRAMQTFDAVKCRSNIGFEAMRTFMVASLYRSATAFTMPIMPASAEVVRHSVDQLFDVSATRYTVSGPLTLTNVMPTVATHFEGEAWTSQGNILVRLSGRLSIRESGKAERQIEFFHELRNLKFGPVDRKLFDPPADFERAKVEIDLLQCQ